MTALPALTLEEIDAQGVELLPERDTMAWGLVNVTNIVGVNIALAINAASIQADASAVAGQLVGVLGT